MTAEDAMQIGQTVLRFWRDLDRRDYATMVAVLAPDCRWLRETWIEGPEAILASLGRRPATLTTRHLATNLVISALEDGAEVQHLVTTFAGEQGAGEGPLPIAAPILVADLAMALAYRDSRWLISRIEPSIIFR